VKPIPVVFHLGPLTIHTYGLGLALTFYVAFRYLERRLARAGQPTEWVAGMTIAVVIGAILGARAMHVLANWSYYGSHLGEIPLIWRGGLSSFGGLIVAVPIGLAITRRRCPSMARLAGTDLVAPVLMAAWAMGRLLGPQLMVAGGGHPSTAWFAMSYADQIGRRVPVPIIQALEDAATFVVLLVLERALASRASTRALANPPHGLVTACAMVLWGITRGLDEHFLLDGGSNLGSLLVEWASLGLVVAGCVLGIWALGQWRDATDGAAEATPSDHALQN
jgi:phosphatidylglycerol---prolipoprotein diacylglyceryl transferase